MSTESTSATAERPHALALATQPLAPLAPFDFTREQVELIKDQIAPGVTDGELSLFIEVCRARRLNPFTRQIYAIKRSQKRKEWVTLPNGGRIKEEREIEVMTIQTGIEGFRTIAERTGRWEGQEGTWWCGEDMVWHEVWLSPTPPKAAKVSVYKRGFRSALYAVAHWDEYAAENQMWKKMPRNQLAKCAEALALRKAFPDDLAGLYIPEEMDQADRPAPAVSGGAPAATAPPPPAAHEPQTPIPVDHNGVPTDEGLMQLHEVTKPQLEELYSLIMALPSGGPESVEEVRTLLGPKTNFTFQQLWERAVAAHRSKCGQDCEHLPPLSINQEQQGPQGQQEPNGQAAAEPTPQQEMERGTLDPHAEVCPHCNSESIGKKRDGTYFCRSAGGGCGKAFEAPITRAEFLGVHPGDVATSNPEQPPADNPEQPDAQPGQGSLGLEGR